MAEPFDTNNTGTLSKNDKKTLDWHADYKGTCEIGGVAYFIDGKIRERKADGSKFLSLKFKPKDGGR